MKVISMKKAFTLIEMAIVLVVIGIVMGGILSISKAAYDKNKIESTQSELENIKTALISYASTYGKLPYPDSSGDGVGDSSTITLGTLPYIDLQIKSTDAYGMNYMYDVNDILPTSDDSNICTNLKAIKIDNSDYPRVSNNSAIAKYAVAVYLLSRGKDKELTGQNSYSGTNDRVYEMSENRYNENDNNDLVLEISVYELLGSICSLQSFGE